MILDGIVAEKERAHRLRDRARDLAMRDQVSREPRPFAAHLLPRQHDPLPRVIAEFKRRSPSAGDIRPGGSIEGVAREYLRAGAVALSILTDGPFFGGSLDDLRAVSRSLEPNEAAPLLRKDFLLHEEDLVDAKVAGAACALLIVRLLDDATLRDLLRVASEIGLEALVEVHADGELDRALDAGARLVGVNHRDLDTLHVDLDLSARLAPRIPEGVTRVAESGLRTAADLREMRARGYHAVLIGESLLRAPSPGGALAALLAP